MANSLKRVVILFAAVLFLGEKVTPRKFYGSCIAIGGVTLYSMAKTIASSNLKDKTPKKVVEMKVVEGAEQPGTWQP